MHGPRLACDGGVGQDWHASSRQRGKPSMRVGMTAVFQNPGKARRDFDVYQDDLRLADLAEPLGLGSMVVVLPWHDPMRVAEQISMLDNISGGRLILGLGRGAGKVEFEGFR